MKQELSQPPLRHRCVTNPMILYSFRLFAFLFLVVNFSLKYIYTSFLTGLKDIAIFMTYWGLIFTIVFFGVSFFFSRPASTYRCGIWFHVCLLFEIIITFGYWTWIFPTSKHPTTLHLWVAIFNHSVPLFFLIIEFVIGNIILVPISIVYFLIIFFVYVGYNAVLTLAFDVEIYKFIDPRNWRFILILLGEVLASLFFWGLTLLLQKWKFEPISQIVSEPVRYSSVNA